MRIFAIVTALLAAMHCIAAGESTVTATGMGLTYREAVNEALLSALEQHDGVSISSEARSSLVDRQSISVTTADGRLSRTELNDSISSEMKKWANGKITGYSVLSETFDPSIGQYRVDVAVNFPSAYVVGRDPANLRRMAVVPFRPSGTTFYWYGQAGGTMDWATALADKLNIALTQTRKFSMLDRKFDAELNDELSRLSAANASKADAVRLCQQLGTDYLVVGDIALSNVSAPGVHPITGQPLPVVSQPFAEVTYRVLLAPTGQLKWMDTIKLDAMAFASSPDLQSFMSATATAAATAIADGMMSNILPLEIVSRTQSGLIVIGEGGKSLSVGERFTVYALGEKVVDSRTGEVLDYIEDAVGTVEVVRVQEKLSYARAIEGDPSLMVAGSRLRREPLVPSYDAAPAPQPFTPVHSLPSGGVVVPF